MARLWMIRHGPAIDEGRLAGRRDVPCRTEGAAALAAALGTPDRVLCSPALRARQTAAALWPGLPAVEDARLWEQDFGAWEGLPYAELPDLGPLTGDELARRPAPGGESFSDVVQRTSSVFDDLDGTTAVVAHAGTVRAAIARACGSAPAALAFRIDPLSVTEIEATPAGWAVLSVNRR